MAHALAIKAVFVPKTHYKPAARKYRLIQSSFLRLLDHSVLMVYSLVAEIDISSVLWRYTGLDHASVQTQVADEIFEAALVN